MEGALDGRDAFCPQVLVGAGREMSGWRAAAPPGGFRGGPARRCQAGRHSCRCGNPNWAMKRLTREMGVELRSGSVVKLLSDRQLRA